MIEKQLNYRLVGGALGALLLFATAVYFVHGYQMGRNSETLRTQAEQAEQAGQIENAITHLERYLALTPGDTHGLEHLADLLEKQGARPNTRWRIAALYEQVLDRTPARDDLRRRVVPILMGLDEYDRATRHVEILLSARPDDGELENLLGHCQEAMGDYDQAATSYEKAIGHAPDRVAAHAHLAALLRYRLGKPVRADEVIDTLVRLNPKSAEAWLERGLYQLGVGLVEAAGLDMEQARALAPDDPRVLVASAELFQRLGRSDEARKSWERGREKYPVDLTMYLGLATLQMQTDQPDEAVACLEQARQVDPANADVVHLLTEAFLQQNRPDKAREVAARLNRDTEPPGLSDYLTGRILQSAGQWEKAVAKLERAARDPDAGAALAARAWLALGNSYEKLGDGDRQVSAFQKAVALEPSLEPARHGLANAYLALGKVEEALDQYRQITQQPHPPEAVWVLFGRTLVQRNLALPPGKRNWEECDRALARADKLPSQVVAAALARADSLMARGDSKQAQVVLEAARTDHGDAVALWAALAALAARQGDWARSTQVMADARKKLGDSPELTLAELDLRAGQEGADVERFLQSVEQDSANYAPAARTRVLTQVAAAYYRLRRPQDGDRICRQLVVGKPLDLQTATGLLDLVLEGGDAALQNSVLEELHTLEGDNGTWWRYGEAVRKVTRAWHGDRSGLVDARALRVEIEKRRPSWARAAVLGALLDDLGGEAAKALDGYLRAFDLGERQPGMVQHLVQRLVAAGRLGDADDVVRRFQQQVVLCGSFARLAAEIARRTRQFDRAAALARQAVAADSPDYQSHLWLGQVLAACGQPDEAEAAFRRAVALADDVPDSWVALVSFLANADRTAAAEAAFAAMQTKIAPDRREVTLGLCAEALGRSAVADQSYQAARREQPRDALVLQRLAAFYLRQMRYGDAAPVLRDLTDPANTVPKETVAWARRQRAFLLALNGDDRGYEEALDLLDRNRRGGPVNGVEQRALELVRAARPAARHAALQAIEQSAATSPLGVDEELFVARLYDADDDWPHARDHLLSAIALDPRNPEYLAYYVRGLLGRGKKHEARAWLAKLERLEPDSERVKKFRVEVGPAGEGSAVR
jgi:tetratricopeptide (TPR) repeat protein